MHIKKLLLKALFLLPCAVWSMGAMAQDGKQYLALKINGEAVFIALRTGMLRSKGGKEFKGNYAKSPRIV